MTTQPPPAANLSRAPGIEANPFGDSALMLGIADDDPEVRRAGARRLRDILLEVRPYGVLNLAAGAESLTLEQLPEMLPKMDIVIGSVPKRLLEREQLALLPKHAMLVDVAAPPGTIDREAAAELGLKTVWARGMGARAPITVGRSQWSGISRRITGILEQKS